jgi:hypothetical protein
MSPLEKLKPPISTTELGAYLLLEIDKSAEKE